MCQKTKTKQNHFSFLIVCIIMNSKDANYCRSGCHTEISRWLEEEYGYRIKTNLRLVDTGLRADHPCLWGRIISRLFLCSVIYRVWPWSTGPSWSPRWVWKVSQLPCLPFPRPPPSHFIHWFTDPHWSQIYICRHRERKTQRERDGVVVFRGGGGGGGFTSDVI